MMEERDRVATERTGPACDQCNARKIKCRPSSSGDVCQSCAHSSIRCTRLKIHKKRGPKRSRANTIDVNTSEPSQYHLSGGAHSSTGTAGNTSSFTEDDVTSFLQSITTPPQAAFQNMHSPSRDWNLISTTSNQTHIPQPTLSSASAANLQISTQQWTQSVNTQTSDLGSTDWPNANDLFDAQSIFTAWPVLSPSNDEVRSTFPFFGWAQTVPIPVQETGNIPQVQPAMHTGTEHRSPSDNGSLVLPTNMDVDQCLDTYCELFRPWCPVLSRTRLRDDFHKALAGSDSRSLTLAQSVCVLVELRVKTTTTPTSNIGESRWLSLLESSTKPTRAEDITIYRAMTALHIFLSWEVIGEHVAAWLQFQQAVTLAEMLGITDWRNKIVPSELTPSDQEQLRLFYTLFIIERAHSILQHTTKQQPLPSLRLPDDAYGTTTAFRGRLAPDALDDFPLDHLRLFSLVKSQHMPCWGGTCGGQSCETWTVDEASRFQLDLGSELELAIGKYEIVAPAPTVRRTVNLIITLAWFRDRFWNVSLRHGLICTGGPAGMDYQFIIENLERLIGLLAGMQVSDFGVGLDYGAKLSDMAMTAISILKMAQSPMSSTAELGIDRDLPTLKNDLCSWAYKIIGLLSARTKEHSHLLKALIQGLAPVV